MNLNQEMSPYAESVRAVPDGLRPGMSFLSENPEAFGQVPDARPIATGRLLIAANGHGGSGNTAVASYAQEIEGVEGLFENVYNGLLRRTEETVTVLRSIFPECEERQEQTVARYCATLTEVAVYQLLRGAANGASFEQSAILLGDELPRRLRDLREIMKRTGGLSRDEAVHFTVSMAACRLTERGEGTYELDIFSAGDFRLFLLDEDGMSPLWDEDTPVLTPDIASPVGGRSLVLHHPGPFALLLLSDSVSAPNAAEFRALQEAPGLIWRYRMRLEEYFLRILTSCVREQEFGERAARFFTGRSHGRDSASGAVLISRGNTVSYEVFRSLCQNRLSELESHISLLPDGYDPARVTAQSSRTDTEQAFISDLLDRDPDLAGRISEAIRVCALDKLRDRAAEPVPPPADVPDYRRLSAEEVYAEYRVYDVENDGDRARYEENRRVLRETLADHWITLRPLLLEGRGHPAPAVRLSADRAYAACLDMNARLADILDNRAAVLEDLETMLADSLEVLRCEGNDWLCGRAGDSCSMDWANDLSCRLPEALAPLLTGWKRSSEEYRSLHTAYTAEREWLFRLDTDGEGAPFAAELSAILEGSLPEARWLALGHTLKAAGVPDAFTELWEALRRVSLGSAALLSRIGSRSAEMRMARELSNRRDLLIAAYRAAAYRDRDWGETVISVMDPTERNEYHAMVRRWMEARELTTRRAEVYHAYAAVYNAYR